MSTLNDMGEEKMIGKFKGSDLQGKTLLTTETTIGSFWKKKPTIVFSCCCYF